MIGFVVGIFSFRSPECNLHTALFAKLKVFHKILIIFHYSNPFKKPI